MLSLGKKITLFTMAIVIALVWIAAGVAIVLAFKGATGLTG